MLSLKYKDIKNRYQFYKNEIDKNALKFFFVNSINNADNSTVTKKKLTHYYINKLNTKYSKTKIQRRCLLTNRARVSNRNFGISRVKLREMLKYNIIPGYKKAIW